MKILLLGVIVAITTADRIVKDPIKDFCRRHLHQTCIVDSKLYIDGGMVYYSDDVNSWDNKTTLMQNTDLIWEDVNDTDNSQGFPVQYANLSKGSEIPSVSGGVLWPDTVNKYFYLFGGEYETIDAAKGKDSQGIDLWKYDTIYNNWTKTKPHSTQNKVKWPAFGAGAVHENGWGYYYGGYLTNRSTSGWTGERQMLNTLWKYDMNSTIWSDSVIDKTARAEGTLQYIPASAGGMLVYFGGVDTNPSSGAISHEIRVYDIADDRWYVQTAGGQIPLPRRGFCAGAVWAKDRSSYNIYIFGGISANGAGLGDIHVLSLPSFQWFLVAPNPNLDIFTKGKAWSSCNVIHNSQFMVIGGYYVNQTQTECDLKIIGGQHAAFLGQESVENAVGGNVSNPAWWHGPMNNVTRYRVPDSLTKVIGGNNEGGATAKSPPAGWKTNSQLSVYFGATYSAKVRTATREIPSATNSSSGSGHKPNVGAIAGGAVGGVVVLLVVIALVVFCLRSRRRRRDAQAQNAESVGPAHHLHRPEMARKSVASVSVSQGTTLNSPHPQSPSWSPHGSTPPPAAQVWNGAMPIPDPYYRGSSSTQHHMSGEWGQLGQHVYPQTYYPPPSDPCQSPKRQYMHAQSVEMPSVRSPPIVAEMPIMKSPVPLRGPQQ
ncbi:hypothetical protein DE146DRAFT_729175 [Phaeosphaeria sp. MPI-PUGE-AT-0046c]|nr:hypothetical protein DE146DRAFT_729175 [Phaeosphaeria sp. MPI-PUGE-AT-0046c]